MMTAPVKLGLCTAAAAIAGLLGTATAGAQGIDPQCAAGYTQDACQKTVDVFQYLAPQLGVVIAGGNATLGVGGTIGGLGRIYISGRANIVSADVPRVDRITPSISGARADQYSTQSQIAGIPQADAAIGIFRGIPVGVTNVGGLDLLVSASYLPALDVAGVSLRLPKSSFGFGAGARVGIIQESIFFPGLSATYLRRTLPTANLSATAGSDSLRIDNLDIHTDSWRLVASKSFFVFGLAAGFGRDRYTSSAEASASVNQCTGVCPAIFAPTRVGPVRLAQRLTRSTYFVDGSLNFPFVRVIGEVGQTGAVNVPTYNTFAGSAPGASRVFGALGLRFGL